MGKKKLYKRIFIVVTILAILTNIGGLLAIKMFDSENPLISVLYIAIYTFPLNLISSIGFNYYYGKKIEYLPYSVLNILFITANILTSILIQTFHMGKTLSIENYIGFGIIILGIYFINQKDT